MPQEGYHSMVHCFKQVPAYCCRLSRRERALMQARVTSAPELARIDAEVQAHIAVELATAHKTQRQDEHGLLPALNTQEEQRTWYSNN